MSTTEENTITPSSGNIYADLGLSNPEERQTKAELTRQIDAILTERKLTQRAAAAILGIPQPKVSNLLNGRLSGFSVERLMQFLTALNRNVQIVLTPTVDAEQRGEITVAVRTRTGRLRSLPGSSGDSGGSLPAESMAASGRKERNRRRTEKPRRTCVAWGT